MTGLGKTAFFGPFALDLETGELRKGGVRIRLQNQPFQILRKLVEHPGRVVTREDLRRHLWPEDTFVDFESGLNTAANRLRLALCDSAENPRYVETLPRVGYRFIAAVEYNVEAPEPYPVLTPVDPASLEGIAVVPPRGVERLRWQRYAFAFLLFLLGMVTAVAWTHLKTKKAAPVFKQLTFRKGIVDNAQFTPGGEVVYSAIWNDQPRRLYLMNVVSPESRELEFGNAQLAAVSKYSDVSFLRSADSGSDYAAELAVAPLHGGAPRVVDHGIEYADWGPGGVMCVVRKSARGQAIEYPAGKTVYQTSRSLGRPRVSPDGLSIGVVEHGLREDDAGYVVLIGRDGKSRRLSEGWASINGLAWSPKGDEIWFAAAKQGINRELYAVSLNGQVRHVAAMPAVLDLFDIASSGRVLIGRSTPRLSLYMGDLKSSTVKDISWLDWSRIAAVSANGDRVLFDESGEGGGELYTVYLYRRNAGTTERVGPGRAMDLSQDGGWILVGDHAPSSRLKLVSANDATTKTICAPGFTYQNARFSCNSGEIVVQLSRGGNPDELYMQNVNTGALRRIGTIFNFNCISVSPGGVWAAGYISNKQVVVIDLRSGVKSVLDSPDPSTPAGWASDDEMVLASIHGKTRRLEKVNLETHQRQPLGELPSSVMPSSGGSLDLVVSADLKTFAFSRQDEAIGLFAVDGWS
jgi:DNA-binding winged helix-turn-helix (wHTH) protein